jgi:hypothetical protein
MQSGRQHEQPFAIFDVLPADHRPVDDRHDAIAHAARRRRSRHRGRRQRHGAGPDQHRGGQQGNQRGFGHGHQAGISLDYVWLKPARLKIMQRGNTMPP